MFYLAVGTAAGANLGRNRVRESRPDFHRSIAVIFRRDHININVFNILKLLGGYLMTAIEKFIEWARANRYNPDELTTLHIYERHCKISRSIANKIADEYHLEGPEWRESL